MSRSVCFIWTTAETLQLIPRPATPALEFFLLSPALTFVEELWVGHSLFVGVHISVEPLRVALDFDFCRYLANGRSTLELLCHIVVLNMNVQPPHSVAHLVKLSCEKQALESVPAMNLFQRL